MAVGDRVDQFRALARQALGDLFNQSEPFGRLALVQVLMLSGDTLVTISLAGSLFFSISPHEAKSKVFLYLVLTLAPFAIVSPLLGPLIDRSRGARRAMVVFSALGRCVICPLMAIHIHGLLLFPLAFLILVLSKLYLVTRGALVPEMVHAGYLSTGTQAGRSPAEMTEPPDVPTFFHGEALGFPPQPEDRASQGAGIPPDEAGRTGRRPVKVEYAALNARLTLLGTLAGFVVSVPGIILLKLAGAPGVLIFAALVFAGGAVAGFRLPVPRSSRQGSGRASRGGPAGNAGLEAAAGDDLDRDLGKLQPLADPEVLFGLTTMSLIRGLAGFLVFLLAFGLRREHAALWWYGFALAMSGVGALVGLVFVARLRRVLLEQQILLGAIWLIAATAIVAAFWGTLLAQVLLAAMVGVAGALAQPSFDALAQQYVPLAAQGRAFARFATRQQLVWVLGALIPVVIAFPFPAGDVVMAAVAGVGGLFYVTSRRALRHRAQPRPARRAG
jgi:Major Facilitator Superfamily